MRHSPAIAVLCLVAACAPQSSSAQVPWPRADSLTLEVTAVARAVPGDSIEVEYSVTVTAASKQPMDLFAVVAPWAHGGLKAPARWLPQQSARV